MPSFQIYPQTFGFSSKNLFEDYLKRQKHDVNKYWSEIDEIITTIVGRNEEALIREVRCVNEFGDN